jgi:CheY-like chemotaxis protein
VSTHQHVVLLVDDEPWFSEALAFALESRGIQCVTATDMTAAIEELQARAVSVLVTDVMMPAGEKFPRVPAAEAGFHFIEHVRKRWPRLPVICLSVIGDQKKIEALRKQGIRYLRKGETPLASAVEAVVSVALGKSYTF